MNLAYYLNSQFSLMQNLEFFARILVACICGGCIGVERSKRFKEAGIRTHVIVCCAAALMMIVSKYSFADLTSDGAHFNGTRGADPARIAAQVVSGISFLGAGVIFKNGNTIKGLTTAAGIWATAGIGLAIGAGMYPLGIFCTIVLAVFLRTMHRFNIGSDSMTTAEIHFTIKDNPAFLDEFNEYIVTQNVQILESKVKNEKSGGVSYQMILRMPKGYATEKLREFIKESGEVKSISSISAN